MLGPCSHELPRWLEDIQRPTYVGGLVEYLNLWDILSDHILISIKLLGFKRFSRPPRCPGTTRAAVPPPPARPLSPPPGSPPPELADGSPLGRDEGGGGRTTPLPLEVFSSSTTSSCPSVPAHHAGVGELAGGCCGLSTRRYVDPAPAVADPVLAGLLVPPLADLLGLRGRSRLASAVPGACAGLHGCRRWPL